MSDRIRTEEVGFMTEATPGTPQGVKTLGIKLPDDIHAQLVLIAGLDGLSLTDAIRQAIDGYIARKAGEGDMAERAARALDEIEREAQQRRSALEALFGQHAQAATEAAGTTRRRGRAESTS
jgi:hypothetical protein